jgi:hypothetical protein
MQTKRPVYEDQDMNATPGRFRAQSGVLLYHLSAASWVRAQALVLTVFAVPAAAASA